MVVDTGLEPVTSSMSRKRASQLRQSTVVKRMFRLFTHDVFTYGVFTYEVETGFEPVYRDLQSLASPLGHSTGVAQCELFRADDGIRTRDPHLGKVMLYH